MDLADEPADRIGVGQHLDIALRHDDHARRAHEVGPRCRRRPAEAVGRPLDRTAAADLDHGIARERLEKRDHQRIRLTGHRGGVDEARRPDLVDAPPLEADDDSRDRRPAHRHAKPGIERDAGGADLVAVFGLQHHATAAGPHPQGQRRGLRLIGERRHESRLPRRQRGIDPPVAGEFIPFQLPVAFHDETGAAALPPRRNSVHGKSLRFKRRRARGIERSFALQFDDRPADPVALEPHHGDRRLLGAGPLDQTCRGPHVFQQRLRGQANANGVASRRQVVEADKSRGNGDPPVDPHEALHGHLRCRLACGPTGLTAGHANLRATGEARAGDEAAPVARGGHARLDDCGPHGHVGIGARRPQFHERCSGVGQLQADRFGIWSGLDRRVADEHDRVPPILRTVEPAAIPADGRIGSRIDGDDEASRSLVPRRLRDHKPIEIQRHAHPARPRLPHLDGDRELAVGLSPATGLGERALDLDALEHGGRCLRQSRQPLLESQQIDEVAVAKPGHRHELSGVITQVENLRQHLLHPGHGAAIVRSSLSRVAGWQQADGQHRSHCRPP